MKKKTDNTQDEALRSSDAHIKDIRSGVHVIVNLAKLKKHKLVSAKELEEYLAHVKCEELAMGAILLGRRFKNSKGYFAAPAELFYALRESLSASGRERKIAVFDEAGHGKVYSWSEFCLEFWGVGDHSIRKPRNRAQTTTPSPTGKKPNWTLKKRSSGHCKSQPA